MANACAIAWACLYFHRVSGNLRTSSSVNDRVCPRFLLQNKPQGLSINVDINLHQARLERYRSLLNSFSGLILSAQKSGDRDNVYIFLAVTFRQPSFPAIIYSICQVSGDILKGIVYRGLKTYIQTFPGKSDSRN